MLSAWLGAAGRARLPSQTPGASAQRLSHAKGGRLGQGLLQASRRPQQAVQPCCAARPQAQPPMAAFMAAYTSTPIWAAATS